MTVRRIERVPCDCHGEEKGKEEEEKIQTCKLQSILRAVSTLDPTNKQSSHIHQHPTKQILSHAAPKDPPG